MQVFNIPSSQLANCPPLRVFLQIFPNQYNIATDTDVLVIEDEAMTMAHIWKKLNNEEREQLCTCLSTGRQYKNVHQGLLALLPVVSVIGELNMWNNSYLNLSE